VQDDRFDATDSVTVALFTTTEVEAPLFRLAVEPTAANGLTQPSWLMVDKLVTVQRGRVGAAVGRLSDENMVRLNRALVVFLGLAG
jgi:mRNA interferase MazF